MISVYLHSSTWEALGGVEVVNKIVDKTTACCLLSLLGLWADTVSGNTGWSCVMPLGIALAT